MADASRDRARTTAAALADAALRWFGGLAVLLALWQAVVLLAAPPRYLLPAPLDVALEVAGNGERLLGEAAITLAEILAGLAIGSAIGVLTGIAIALSPLAARLAAPLLMMSQALPVFAIAPLLVLWFGFGMASKIAMATLVIYFPVAAALADGLARTDPGLLDIARLAGAGRWRTLRLIRLPAALPALVTGLRMAAIVAPIGAVIGEWVGAAGGLGFLMVQANARMQTDLLFAAVLLLAAITLLLGLAMKAATARLIPWVEERD